MLVVGALGVHGAAGVAADDVASRRPRGGSSRRRSPAAPSPTIEHVEVAAGRLPVSLTAFSSAASTTTAVPCWSSWKTGMSSARFSRSSISKQRGALMSSRLMPPKPGAMWLDGGDDLVGVLGVEADRERVDAAELLEQQRLALHHRHRRLRADVAEAEHGAAVGHDGDGVALDRVLEGLVAVLGDRAADPRDAGRVGHREVVARAQRRACCAARSCRRRAPGTCGRWCRSAARPRRRRPPRRSAARAPRRPCRP